MSVSLTMLDQLAFNPQNLGGHVSMTTFHFRHFLRGHVRTVSGNMLVKFEVHTFNIIGTISI